MQRLPKHAPYLAVWRGRGLRSGRCNLPLRRRSEARYRVARESRNVRTGTQRNATLWRRARFGGGKFNINFFLLFLRQQLRGTSEGRQLAVRAAGCIENASVVGQPANNFLAPPDPQARNSMLPAKRADMTSSKDSVRIALLSYDGSEDGPARRQPPESSSSARGNRGCPAPAHPCARRLGQSNVDHPASPVFS